MLVIVMVDCMVDQCWVPYLHIHLTYQCTPTHTKTHKHTQSLYRPSLHPACEALTVLTTLPTRGVALPLPPSDALQLTQTMLRTVHVPSFAAGERRAALHLLTMLFQVLVRGWWGVTCGLVCVWVGVMGCRLCVMV